MKALFWTMCPSVDPDPKPTSDAHLPEAFAVLQLTRCVARSLPKAPIAYHRVAVTDFRSISAVHVTGGAAAHDPDRWMFPVSFKLTLPGCISCFDTLAKSIKRQPNPTFLWTSLVFESHA